MTARFLSGFSKAPDRKTLRYWSRAADDAGNMDYAELEQLRSDAGALRERLDRLIHVADGRLAWPRAEDAAVEKPLHCDWAWRPPLFSGPVSPTGQAAVGSGTRFGKDTAVFHDCSISELTFRQIRNHGATDLAPFGARLDVFRFDGSFLSLVVDLPPDGVTGISRRHLVGLTIEIELERPLEVFARLNVRHGPNTEQIVREFPMNADSMSVEFDLAYTDLNEKRIERAWLDLIFEGPKMNQITLRDVKLTRRPRAEL
ncbi:MAG: DUF6478 family protein [Pseudomonadota bacterium]